MRRWFLLVLVLTLPVAAPAQFTFTTNSGAITIKSYTGSGGSVTIPEATNGYPVTAVGDYAFFYKSTLTNIDIPNSVTSIGDYAFAWCGGGTNGLAYVSLPTNLTRIGTGTFCNCTCLTNVSIPDSVTSIGDNAFGWCYSLNLTNLGNNVVSIGNEAFDSCTSLTSVTVPTGVTNIGNYAFAWCYSLTNVAICSNVTTIGDFAFAGCALSAVTLPRSVANLGHLPFYACGSLASITVDPENAHHSSSDGVLFNRDRTILIEYPAGAAGSYAIPDGLTRVADEAFQGCFLTNLAIPTSVTTIGSAAFSGSGLATVAIPDSVTNIGDHAFAWCTNLISVTLGNGLTSIGDQAFHGCISLPAILVDAANTAYCSVDGSLFDKGTNTLIQCPEGKVGSFALPDGVTSIETNAFRACSKLTRVTIGNDVTNITLDAFSSCSSLTNITLGNSVASLGYYAFYYCTSLQGVYFEGNVPSIEYLPFQGATNVTVYYMPGATGWGSTFAGRPTAVWSAFMPTGLSTIALSANQISLSWNPVGGAASYNVKRSAASGGPYTNIAGGVVATSYLDDGLLPGKLYYYVVSAVVDSIEYGNSAQASAVTLLPVAKGTLVHRYSFGETNGTIVADSVGGSSWNGTLPNGGSFSNGQLTFASSSSQYARLPAGLVSTLSNFTIEVWVKLNSTGNGIRLFDFGNSTTDYMFLSPQSGTSGKLRFGIQAPNGGGVQPLDGTNALATGAWHHIALTLNGTTYALYVNGALIATTNNITLKPSSLGSTTNNWLGRSEFANPYLNGVLDEFRIYNAALSSAEIAATDTLGPNQTLKTASPPISAMVTRTNLTLTWPLDCAGFALQSCTNLSSGIWLAATSAPPQILNGQWQVSLPVSRSNPSTFYRLLK
jgi:hypothetical protein